MNVWYADREQFSLFYPDTSSFLATGLAAAPHPRMLRLNAYNLFDPLLHQRTGFYRNVFFACPYPLWQGFTRWSILH